jgi:hypothetical protein
MLTIRDSRFQQPVSEAGIAEPVLRRLLAEWQAAPAGPNGIPAESFIDPFRLRYMIENLIVVEIAARPGDGGRRYRYRLIGTDLVAHTGRDHTGRWVDQHSDAALAELAIAASDAVAANRQPALIAFRRNFFGRYYPVTALILPLGAAADGGPNRLLVGQVYPKDTPRRPYGDKDA